LNRFLSRHLGDFVALEPTSLSAPAFALAALGDETLGLFRLEGELVRVRRRVIDEAAVRERCLLELNTARRRVLRCKARRGSGGGAFHEWGPGQTAGPGDVVTYLELGDQRDTPDARHRAPSAGDAIVAEARSRRSVRQAIGARWASAPQMARVALVASGLLMSLYVSCALLYRLQYPDIGAHDALNVAMVLILGGFDNLFGQQRLPFPIPMWLHAFSVVVSISGTVAIGIVYAFLTERVLSVRFQLFLRQRAPKADHVVLLGRGPLGVAVAEFLLREKRPIVVVSEPPPDAGLPVRAPIVAGPLEESLMKAHAASARSVVALGDDDVANLEAALTARAMSPTTTLVIRADDTGFRENVAQLVRGARALGVQALAAEAFAAAAFGENIHQLLHVDDRIFLVAEYEIEPTDTLHGRLIAEVAYGFGVLPLLLARGDGRSRDFLPSDDLRLRVGDRFVVLASVEGIRRVESGAVRAPSFYVRLEGAPSEAAAFDGALAIAKVSGCDVALAQRTMHGLPATFSVPLYALQADRMVRELAKVRVGASVATRMDEEKSNRPAEAR
jgi:Trk K+ transport system NAD-binding subunit